MSQPNNIFVNEQRNAKIVFKTALVLISFQRKKVIISFLHNTYKNQVDE